MSSRSTALDAVTLALEDKKACDVKILDVREKTSLADYFIICHATSNAHSKSLTDAVARACKEAGVSAFSLDISANSEWKVLDYGDVIVHLFLEKARRYYDLESIWSAGDPASALEDRKSLEREPRRLDVRSLFSKAMMSSRRKTRR